ncbi:hypothetical protein [Amycolatopsis sp. cg13]|uniref:hypothetical protein n=1 Tax=Amycolatopsis sp. cg13 TaxID=3238807 RepID=UPI0035256460
MITLRAACADDFIDALPDGYANLLGERGVGLSAGQRVALAWASLVMLATHRPALLSDVDRILQVADGRVRADAEAGESAG